MSDFLDILASDAEETIKEGYYKVQTAKMRHHPLSLEKAIRNSRRNPIITEVKLGSPSKGFIREGENIKDITFSMQRGGSIGISFLTEPKHFKGSLEGFREARRMINLPFLMKDFILDPVQIDAASKIGGDAVLLIQALFDRGYCHLSRDEMIQNAHSLGLEVLLESHTREEFQKTLDSQADLIGINNRDLSTLTVNIETTKEILESSTVGERVIISESGIETPQHVKLLRKWGAQGFLVDTAVMAASNIEEKVRELMEA